jgi:ABC-type cobalamin/Fe3+-siderophores transport system ATPase subunit
MLNISKVTLGYNGKAVLQFGGLELPQGGQCLITGPSGSGKTTLLYAIAWCG